MGIKRFITFCGLAIIWVSCQTKTHDTQTLPPTKPTDTTTAALTELPAAETSQPPAPVAPNRLIVPGKSIGQTTLNMEAATVNQLLGPGDKQDAAMGKAWVVWYSKSTAPDTLRKETVIYFVTNMGGPHEASRVKQIRVTSGFFKTAAHLGVGSSLTALQQASPHLSPPQTYTSDQTNRRLTILDDTASGIAFEINAANICTAVVVHEPQQLVNTTYIHLFP